MHILIGNVKAFIAGTYHGLDSRYLQRLSGKGKDKVDMAQCVGPFYATDFTEIGQQSFAIQAIPTGVATLLFHRVYVMAMICSDNETC